MKIKYENEVWRWQSKIYLSVQKQTEQKICSENLLNDHSILHFFPTSQIEQLPLIRDVAGLKIEIERVGDLSVRIHEVHYRKIE